MKVIIFGSTGRTGKYLIKFALESGFEVTAFARNPVAVSIQHPRLVIFQGDATNPAEVEKAMIGKEIVFSAIGTDLGQTNLRQTAIHNIVSAMQKHHVKRIIAVGGMGALQANSEKRIFQTEGFPPEYIPVSKDHNAAYEVLEASGTDFTFVCPPMIVDGPETCRFVTEANYPPKGHMQMTAGDVAWFIVEESKKNVFLRTRVGICNP